VTTNKDSKEINMSSYRRYISFLLVFSLLLPNSIALAQNKQKEDKKDYYYEGEIEAERDYTGSGAMVGGFVAGTLLGLIGWGLGYLIVSNQSAEVPRRYISELESKDRRNFEDGYINKVKKTRKSKYNVGGGIGTLFAVVLVLGSSS